MTNLDRQPSSAAGRMPAAATGRTAAGQEPNALGMMNVTDLVQTCEACPSQWEGRTDDGREFYARYRHGTFRVDVGGQTVFVEHPGEGLAGYMTTEQMQRRVRHLFAFSATGPTDGTDVYRVGGTTGNPGGADVDYPSIDNPGSDTDA